MDRQDIDALLIGALYGELTPAEEARLASHLESHPADRGALDDLKHARQVVRDSRIFAVQAEPPQAISALLLQEAHRRAPKRVAAPEEKESWFARFTRSFIAHPAMAAATMLVLVLGGAGIMYSRKGSDQVATREADQSAPATATATIAPTQPQAEMAPGAGSAAYQAGLYEGNAAAPTGGAMANADESAKLADNKATADVGGDTAADRWQSATGGDGAAGGAGAAAAAESESADRAKREQSVARAESQRKASMEVTTDRGRAPKDLAEERKADRDDSLAFDAGNDKAAATPRPAATSPTKAAKPSSKGGSLSAAPAESLDAPSNNTFGSLSSGGGGAGSTANAVSGAGAPSRTANSGYAQPPPPPPPAPTAAPTASPTPAPSAPSPVQAAPTTTATGTSTATTTPPASPQKKSAAPEAKTEAVPAKEKQDSTIVAWARTEHQRAISLARAGNCAAAAKVALAVSTRASSYYSQFMATDRSLKNCAPYIAAEREKDAERTQKARAKRAAEEPAATTTKQ